MTASASPQALRNPTSKCLFQCSFKKWHNFGLDHGGITSDVFNPPVYNPISWSCSNELVFLLSVFISISLCSVNCLVVVFIFAGKVPKLIQPQISSWPALQLDDDRFGIWFEHSAKAVRAQIDACAKWVTAASVFCAWYFDIFWWWLAIWLSHMMFSLQHASAAQLKHWSSTLCKGAWCDGCSAGSAFSMQYDLHSCCEKKLVM